MLFRLFTLLLSFTLFSQEYEITSENIEIDTELNTINYEYNVIFKSDEIFFTADSLKLNQKNVIEDKKSGEYRLSHHIDLKTGFYNGSQVLDPNE